MRKSTSALILIIVALLFSSCSPAKQVRKKLTGAWHISRIEDKTSGNQLASESNLGMIELKTDGTGYHLRRVKDQALTPPDSVHFSWRNTENIITFTTLDKKEAQSWIILRLKKKSQLWKTTEGSPKDQSMTLIRVTTP